jgi:hypothetical protein
VGDDGRWRWNSPMSLTITSLCATLFAMMDDGLRVERLAGGVETSIPTYVLQKQGGGVGFRRRCQCSRDIGISGYREVKETGPSVVAVNSKQRQSWI